MISNIFNNKELPVYAKGNNSREWIHVQDHCEALLKLYLKGKSGESYNIGSGKNMKNIDLVKIKRSKKDDTFNVKVWSKPPEKTTKKKKRAKNENKKVRN